MKALVSHELVSRDKHLPHRRLVLLSLWRMEDLSAHFISQSPSLTMSESPSLTMSEEHHSDITSRLLQEEEEEEDSSPIEQVALTVSTIDDPSLPVSTFRMWTLGISSCILLSFLNQFFSFRTEPLLISSVCAQIAVLPLGRFMASALPKGRLRFPGTTTHFSLNPGPFNVKEHVLITIFANAGASNVFAIHLVTIVKVFYKRQLDFWVAALVVLTTQVLGFGWAGVFRRHLVEPAAMWWPANLVQVSLFRTLHEKEQRSNWGLTRNQFFLIVLTCSFAYYILPGYLFPMLTSLSWLCWVFPRSVIAQQIGSGLHGLGLGAIGLDWTTISSYLGSPLASPWFVIVNVMLGFGIVTYVLNPLAYYVFNIYNARTFPIFSSSIFTASGQPYNISAIIDDRFQLDVAAYERNGRVYMSSFFVISYGAGFAALAATLTHALLFHSKEIWQLSRRAVKEGREDIHSRLMRRYQPVPDSWFVCLMVGTIAVTILACEGYNEQLQLRWWGVLLACAVAFIFTLPIGIITATTNQSLKLNIITEYIIGYLYPGKPVANVCFKVYGYVSIDQALSFLQDFKLGHYMKIPPRNMFVAQVTGTIIAAMTYLVTAWWMIESISNICSTDMLPSNSPWTCPLDHVAYSATIIWGLIGTKHIFGTFGLYYAINWSFLLGALATMLIWLLRKSFPRKAWIKLINVPVLLGATWIMPPASTVNFTSWCMVGVIFSFFVFRYHKTWWQRYNYILSGGLDAGLALMGILIYFCLGINSVSLTWWGEKLDNCPLATCSLGS